MKKKINLSRIVFAALVGFIIVVAMNYKRMGEVTVVDFEEVAGEPVLKAYLRHKSVTYNLYSSYLREEQLLLSKVKAYGA